MRPGPRPRFTATGAVLGLALSAALLGLSSIGASAAAPPSPTTLSADFSAAAAEFGVPASVLEALGYYESAWDGHGGAPSTSGGFGIMQLTDISPETVDGLGADAAKTAAVRSDPSLSTLRSAALLIGADPAVVRTDDRQNIRAAAALLASYAKVIGHGRARSGTGDWYGAVAEYSGAADSATAAAFADGVFGVVRSGRSTAALTLAADPSVVPDTSSLAALGLPAPAKTSAGGTALPECPASLGCDYVPAALKLNNPKDKTSYGDYDPANRPAFSPIRYITLHDTEESYAGTIRNFQKPSVYASAHYVVRSGDGHVTQFVPTQDIAWDSANWTIYQHSVSIEQEGWAMHGATWYSESLYHSTARLVRYLAARFGVPLDRQHIFGHDNIQGSSDHHARLQHWDPGPYWDWSHFMDLIGAPIRPDGSPSGNVVVIRPDFRHNAQVVSGCTEVDDPTPGAVPGRCGEFPAQPTSFVYLHTAPDLSSPLMSDPYLHPDGSAGTDAASDWGDKASVGEKFVVADRKSDAGGLWTAVWFAGTKAWFHSAPNDFAALPSSGLVITPKPGLASIPVYATAAPEASAYPPEIAAKSLRTPKVLTKYSIPAGQSYVASGPAVHGEYWFAWYVDGTAPGDRTEVEGKDLFYLITYNHRMAWVNAADVVARQVGRRPGLR